MVPVLKTGQERKQRSRPGVIEMAEAGLMHTALHIVPCIRGAFEGRSGS